VTPFEGIGDRVNYYRDELDKQGKEFDPYSIAVTRGLMVANDDKARAEAHTLRGKFITEVQVLATDKKFQAKSFNPVADSRWKDRNDPVAISEAGAIVGNSDEMGERIQTLYDLGVRNVLVHDLAGVTESLIQFAEEVMPHFLDKDDPVPQAAE
jgi:alkanesulfonate monooxygenase SsuD/methylene tetrahydromethanopterin reductase-like flavin-dependent oxidoreductase (luciferase family)